MSSTLGDSRRRNDTRSERRQPGKFKFAGIATDRSAGFGHRPGEIARGQVPNKLSCLLCIPQRIFCPDAGKPDDGRLKVEKVEKTVWGQIVDASRAGGRDPADRPRANNRCQRVVEEAMSLRRLIGMPVPAFDCGVRAHGRSADLSAGAILASGSWKKRLAFICAPAVSTGAAGPYGLPAEGPYSRSMWVPFQ